MTSPTPIRERRTAPRTTVNGLAYINLDSNNGAIVLNVSLAGLCFHSVAPIQKSEAIRFWFSHDNRRIDVHGQLAWMDEKQKTVGLRFANLSTEARRQIRAWMVQPAAPAASVAARLAPSASPHAELPRHRSAALPLASPKSKAPELWRGFSAGVVFGLLVSALVAAAILLYVYRHEVGRSLVHLGQRLEGRTQTQTASAAPETTSPPIARNPPAVKLLTRPQTNAVEPQPVEPTARASATATRAPTTAVVAAPKNSSLPPSTSLPKASAQPGASDISGKTSAVPIIETANPPSGHAADSAAVESGSYATMYLEVGKFHDVTLADRTTNKLHELGFPASVVHKGHLWMSSYQVLVGPYTSDEDAKAAREVLESQGFTPRAFERGSRSFWLFPTGLMFHGTHLPVGNCVISWESYVSDAVVKIEKEGSVVVTAQGKWMKLGSKNEWNAIVFQNNPDGSRTLLEIRFVGMSRALVLGE